MPGACKQAACGCNRCCLAQTANCKPGRHKLQAEAHQASLLAAAALLDARTQLLSVRRAVLPHSGVGAEVARRGLLQLEELLLALGRHLGLDLPVCCGLCVCACLCVVHLKEGCSLHACETLSLLSQRWGVTPHFTAAVSRLHRGRLQGQLPGSVQAAAAQPRHPRSLEARDDATLAVAEEPRVVAVLLGVHLAGLGCGARGVEDRQISNACPRLHNCTRLLLLTQAGPGAVVAEGELPAHPAAHWS